MAWWCLLLAALAHLVAAGDGWPGSEVRIYDHDDVIFPLLGAVFLPHELIEVDDGESIA